MKKRNQQTEKKLSLKKLQLMKINDMKTINGGGGAQVFDYNTGDGQPTPPIRQMPSAQCDK